VKKKSDKGSQNLDLTARDKTTEVAGVDMLAEVSSTVETTTEEADTKETIEEVTTGETDTKETIEEVTTGETDTKETNEEVTTGETDTREMIAKIAITGALGKTRNIASLNSHQRRLSRSSTGKILNRSLHCDSAITK
jgi:hypothetical protein